MSRRGLTRDTRGVSHIVAQVLLLAVITSVMGVMAYQIVSEDNVRERFVDFDVRLENAGSLDRVKVVLTHMGGDDITITKDNELEEIRVSAHPPKWENVKWENAVPYWTSFTEPADGFETAENATGYIRHDDASMPIGYELNIVITSTRTDKMFLDREFTVENSSLY